MPRISLRPPPILLPQLAERRLAKIINDYAKQLGVQAVIIARSRGEQLSASHIDEADSLLAAIVQRNSRRRFFWGIIGGGLFSGFLQGAVQEYLGEYRLGAMMAWMVIGLIGWLILMYHYRR